ncbi:hypothetical protein [Candidatus Marithrix sp. Canyon 246]|uniref:hypothetical protein n=1 Tax=Candidatus Marithrix sp. Canyon 246 TaxID=1827136 RepID=UPI00084A1387|nr:hypothetical protein [Candidatus Marithrix sp. Canyon 246]
MANQIDKKTMQKALVGATMLATSPAWAKGGGDGTSEGGKSQLGVNHLTLEEFAGNNASVCANPDANTTKGSTNTVPNDLTIAVDPFTHNFMAVEFLVRDVLAQGQDQMLFLVYSSQLSPTPQIPTPKSTNKLGIDLSGLEIVAIMDIPSQRLLTQGSSRLGAADPRPHSAVSFNFNFDTSVLPGFIRDNSKVYFQAALLSKSNYNAGRFDEMILSEVDTIGFVPNNCAAGDNVNHGSTDGKGGSQLSDGGGHDQTEATNPNTGGK